MDRLHRWGWPLVAATALVGLPLLAVGWLGIFGPATDDAPTGAIAPRIALRVAGEPLTVPADLIRFADQRRPGDHQRLDIAFDWPSGEPAGRRARPAGETNAADAPMQIVASIERRDGALDTGARVATVYGRFFDGEAAAAPGGLLAQRMKPGSGYEDEIIVFEPGAVRPFAARCFAGERADQVEVCLREVLVGRDLLVAYRFPYRLVGDWREMDRGVRDLIGGFLGS